MFSMLDNKTKPCILVFILCLDLLDKVAYCFQSSFECYDPHMIRVSKNSTGSSQCLLGLLHAEGNTSLLLFFCEILAAVKERESRS